MNFPAQSQLLQELSPTLDRLTLLTNPAAGRVIRDVLDNHAGHLISLLQASDEHKAPDSTAIADAIIALIHGPQEEPPPQWWRTPLGQLVAPHVSEAALTNSQAADILGLQRGTISVMIRRGNLDTLPSTRPRKISRRAVLARLQVPNTTKT